MVTQSKQLEELTPVFKRPGQSDSKQSIQKEFQRKVQTLLSSPIEYMAHDAFEAPDAYSQIFEQAPLLPDTDSSWYHPAMDSVDSKSQLRNSKIENHVLTAAEEEVIFKQFNYARYRAALLQEKASEAAGESGTPKLNARDSRALIHWVETAEKIRAQIVHFNLGLVLAMVKRFDKRNDAHDMLSEGHLILLYSIDKFDISQGYKFSTYACRSILRGMAKVAEKQSVRRTHFVGGFDEGREITEPFDFVDTITTQDGILRLKEILEDNTADLTELEIKILKHRFPIDQENPEWMTLRQLGKLLGYTKERIRQLQFTAIAKLKEAMDPEIPEIKEEKAQ